MSPEIYPTLHSQLTMGNLHLKPMVEATLIQIS